MLKIFKGILALAIIIALCAICKYLPLKDEPSGNAEGSLPTATEGEGALNFENVKAIWLSQYDMYEVFTESGEQRAREDFSALAGIILDNIKVCGFNTVFLQVRPFGDSICRSDIYPASYILTGAYGREPSYDAAAILVEEAHRRGLSIHAWINPLRCMRADEIILIGKEYKLYKLYSSGENYMKALPDGRLYLDPSRPEVRELIVSGACELLENYDFDGLHLDDYFYPTAAEYFDRESYADYLTQGGTLSLGDFRRAAINTLVHELYATVHESGDGRIFGISPSSNAEGAYTLQFADVYAWCAEDGYVDYICPQVYFGFEHQSAPFDIICRRWESYISESNVKLIIGVTLGKAHSGIDENAGSGRYEWRDRKDVLVRSLDFSQELEGCVGMSFFSYQFFFDPTSSERVDETREEVDALIPILKEASWQG